MKKKLLGTLATTASLAALLLPVTPASAAPSSTLDTLAYGQLKAYAYGIDQCITVTANGSTGDHPTLYGCNQFDDQMWYYPKPGTVGPIINKYSLKYLTAQGFTPGSPAFMYFNSGYADQQWWAEPVDATTVRFRNQHSDLCLVIQRYNGAQAMQYECTGYNDQKWVVW
ncbi:RICIN domain-containing protein [Kitasatospora sp. NPDC101183]|uniref:RICIN domain-containing protein n=1 Tax=Kitasatospora sp. NPDC101183 TaxID=3364100 RepID=UPI0037FEDA8A